MLSWGVCLILVLCSLLISHQGAAAADTTDTKGAIEAVLDEQVQGWNEGDIEKYMIGYDRSDSLRFASGGNVYYGWQATLERYKTRYPDKAAMGILSFSDLDIAVVSEDAALVFGQWKLKREEDEPWGLFTLFFRKTSSGWRIVHDHTSSAGK